MGRGARVLAITVVAGAAHLFPLRASEVVKVASAPMPRAARSGYLPGEVIVELRADAGERAIERVLRGVGARRVERGLSGRRLLVTLDASTDAFEAARLLGSVPEIAVAEPNGIVRASQARTFTPNDRFFPFQWNLKLIGAERMWAIQQGSPSVGIAVLDTGVAYEDYTDPGTGQVFRKAPDWGNVTFLPGFDFVNRDSHPNDDQFHGTHVASTIAEATNNDEGMAGIAFNCAIMPVKVLDAEGTGTFFGVAEGIDYAASFQQGASRPIKVINLSLGSENGASVSVENAVNRAVANGVVVVAAAGNDNAAKMDFPASLPNVIAVGALDGRKQKATYSNFGSQLDFVAPGGQCARDDDRDAVPDCIFQQTLDTDFVEQGRFDLFCFCGYQGTSFAVPHVSAVAALLVSQGITSPSAVRAALESTAEDLGAPGKDDTFGFGLLRPATALAGLGLNR